MQKLLRGIALVLFVVAAFARGKTQVPRAAGDNVILITLDGARIEEMFGGMQPGILQSTLREGQKVEDSPAYRRFWAESPQARREKLMPFFWKTLMADHGSIAGNPELGSVVQLTNRHRFSYPGYAEILLGERTTMSLTATIPSGIVHHRPRSHARAPSPGARTCRDRGIMGELQCHRGAHRGGDVRERRPGATGRPRTSTSQYPAGRNVNPLGRHAA